jgi:hypothetical protein
LINAWVEEEEVEAEEEMNSIVETRLELALDNDKKKNRLEMNTSIYT